MALTVGTKEKMTGYITIAHCCYGRTTGALEADLGYNPGSLTPGYWFCLLADTIGPQDFDYRGYTHFSGGVPTGDTRTVGDQMRERMAGTALDQAIYDQQRVKIATTILSGTGPRRVAKVVPFEKPTGYPPGRGAPQWELLVPRQFEVVAEVRAGQRLLRGEDGSHRVVVD